MKQIIKQKLAEALLTASIGMLGYLFAMVWKEISLPFAQKVLPELSKKG